MIYVGKAKSLKNRVSSYFQPPVRLGPKTSLLVENIASIDHIPVASETEALLLESRLIKKFKPQFNIISKDDKSPYYIHITKETYPRPVINHEPKNSLAGPFLNALIPRRILKQFRNIAPYCIAPRPVRRPCFYSHIGLCHPCPGEIITPEQKADYKANISRLKRLITGSFKAVTSNLRSEMLEASKNQEFEKAVHFRDQLQALDHLLSQPISPDEYLQNPNLVQDTRNEAVGLLQSLLSLPKLSRIEMYDNAHLSGTAATAAMVVSVDGELLHRLYRHFKIKTAPGNSDVDMMKEVLSRRLKRQDWPVPDLIVLDGGKPQLLASADCPYPVIALAKRLETIIYKNPAGEYVEVNPPIGHPALRLLQSMRDEAHRFSRRLHHKLRKKELN